jgi:hypothetical protein
MTGRFEIKQKAGCLFLGLMTFFAAFACCAPRIVDSYDMTAIAGLVCCRTR